MATFQVYTDSREEYRWTLRADNGEVIADSGEGYRHRADCLHGVELVKDAAYAPAEDGE